MVSFWACIQFSKQLFSLPASTPEYYYNVSDTVFFSQFLKCYKMLLSISLKIKIEIIQGNGFKPF